MFIPTRLYTMVTSTNLLSRNTSFLLFDRAWYIHFPYFYFIPENTEEVGAGSMLLYWNTDIL